MATTKQKLVAQNLLENTGKSVSRAMKEVGYKRGSYLNPQQLTRSKGWINLMKKHLPDSLLAQRHNDLLNKKEFIAIGKAGERELVETGEIDANAVAKGLDMAYKLKSKYPNKQFDNESDQASQEVREIIFRVRKLFPESNPG